MPGMEVLTGAIIYSNLLVLLAVGLTLAYITTAVPNFAQGSFAVVGSYTALTVYRLFSLHPYYSLPLAFLAGGAVGLASYVFVLRPLIRRGATVVTLMIATLALDLILLGLRGIYAGYLGKLTGSTCDMFMFAYLNYNIFGLPSILIVSTLVIILTFGVLFTLLYKTKFGIALRASMENPALAEIMGVNVEYTRMFAWFLSGALAALAGCLLPFKQEIVPATAEIIIVSIFAASIVGGLNNIYGALIGGYIVGMSESLVTYWLSTVFGTGMLVYSKVVALTIIIATLLIAPQGIAGIDWRAVRKRLRREVKA